MSSFVKGEKYDKHTKYKRLMAPFNIRSKGLNTFVTNLRDSTCLGLEEDS